jgi:FAD synthetase
LAKADVDKGYPDFTRVNPIFRWNYQQVWKAIKKLHIPYCELYDQGYSSLGNMQNTIKNPTLISENNGYKDPEQAI